MKYIGYQGDGVPGGRAVVVVGDDGQERTLPGRQDLFDHSPDGFMWGYSGSGPAQLSLAILCHHFEHAPAERIEMAKKALVSEDYTLSSTVTWPEWLAIRLHQPFKSAVVARFSQDSGFILTSEQVDDAITALVSKS